VEELKDCARNKLAHIDAAGGAVEAIEYMKCRLVSANSERIARVESGETVVVGVNRYEEGEESPLPSGAEAITVIDQSAEAEQTARLEAWRRDRDDAAVTEALEELGAACGSDRNVMPASIKAAKAGATTGEWGDVVRAAFGQYRAPTGVTTSPSNRTEGLDDIRQAVDAVSTRLGERLKFLVGKPGLDGHSNGAEQISVRARDVGMNITYEGIRLTPSEIVAAARESGAHVIGLSILSGSHLQLIRETLVELRCAGLGDVPVVVGGIIPDGDAARLRAMGVAQVYTPRDFELNRIMLDIVQLADRQQVAAE
ncbi:MAG: protein meaA, partial [Boseongicola sp. SB0675_bin_26]|nr:protein meaA [Boseongicola sp. SB0675_bin_26]